MSGKLRFTIYVEIKAQKSGEIGSNEVHDGPTGPETCQNTTFSSKMTYVPSIGIVTRSRQRPLKQGYRQLRDCEPGGEIRFFETTHFEILFTGGFLVFRLSFLNDWW